MRLTLHPTPRCVLAPRTKTRAEHSDSLLNWIINNNRRLSERDVRPLAQQLARTLSLTHAHGVVHRSTVLSLLPHDTHINCRKPYHHRSQTRKHPHPCRSHCNNPQSTTPCYYHRFYIRSGHCSRRGLCGFPYSTARGTLRSAVPPGP